MSEKTLSERIICFAKWLKLILKIMGPLVAVFL